MPCVVELAPHPGPLPARGERESKRQLPEKGFNVSRAAKAASPLPACGVRDGVRGYCGVLHNGAAVVASGYIFSRRLALPLMILALSSAQSGMRLSHSVPGALSTNG
jgi:hypothetical protein